MSARSARRASTAGETSTRCASSAAPFSRGATRSGPRPPAPLPLLDSRREPGRDGRRAANGGTRPGRSWTGASSPPGPGRWRIPGIGFSRLLILGLARLPSLGSTGNRPWSWRSRPSRREPVGPCVDFDHRAPGRRGFAEQRVPSASSEKWGRPLQVEFSGEVDGGYASTADHPSGLSAPHGRPRSVGRAWGGRAPGAVAGLPCTALRVRWAMRGKAGPPLAGFRTGTGLASTAAWLPPGCCIEASVAARFPAGVRCPTPARGAAQRCGGRFASASMAAHVCG